MRTTIVIPAMHCPSCVAYLDTLLKELSITNADISFLDRTISFDVPKNLNGTDVHAFLRRLLTTLRTEGYPPDSIRVQENDDPQARRVPFTELDRELSREDKPWSITRWLWRPQQHLTEADVSRKRHEEICSSCRESNTTSTHLKFWKINLSIGGMSV